MHSIRARGGGTKRDLERGFGKERMEQYNAAEARGELSPIDSKVLSREQKTMARQAKRDKRLAKAVDRAGEAGMLLLGIAGATMLFFEICLAVAVSSVRS